MKTLTTTIVLSLAAALAAGPVLAEQGTLVRNGLSLNGLMPNALSFNGLSLNGLQPNALNTNGLMPNALSFNGLKAHAVGGVEETGERSNTLRLEAIR